LVIPYGRHAIDQDDITAVIDVLRSDWLTSGPTVGAFEQELARRCAAAAAVSCANGTAALHLSCLALGLGAEDTAIVPAITFVATANAPRMVGAEIVFADVDPDSGLMEAAHLAQAIEFALNGDVLLLKQVPLRIADESSLAANCGQANVGVILPKQQPILRARGEHTIRLVCALGNEVIDEDTDVTISAREY
jgi:hypothetical protein